MATAGGDDIEVRREDQMKINEFGTLHNRLLEIRADLKQIKEDADKLEDGTTELMMAGGDGSAMLMIGESFFACTEDEANEYCEKKQKILEERTEKLMEEEKSILERQAVLKRDLYARFGESINLETQ